MADPRITPTNTNSHRQGMASQQSANPRNNPGQTAHTVGQMSSYGVARSGMNQIRQGDIVRGEISDLRNNEITITLENNTVIKGQIADSSNLSIGQTAAFRMSSISPSGLLMEAIPNSYTETELTMIHKALEEAGLPDTERNQSAVKALMDNLMPINKQSIQQLMQQAYDLGTDDMESLCLMNRRHLDVNADSAAQFSAYRNASHQLLGRAETFSSQLPQLLEALSENGPSNAVASFGEQLLAIALSGQPGSSSGQSENAALSPLLPAQTQAALSQPEQTADTISQLSLADQDALKAMLAETPLTEQQLFSLQDGTMTQREALLLIRDAIAGQTIRFPEDCPEAETTAKMNEIIQTLRPGPAESAAAGAEPGMTLQHMQSGQTEASAVETPETAPQAPLPETAAESADTDEASSAFTLAGRLFHNISDAAKSSIQNLNQNINQMLTAPREGSTAVTHTPSVIDTLLNNVNGMGQEQNALFTFLSSQERTGLARSLRELPVSAGLSERILSGEASAREVLSAIHDAIGSADSSAVQQLFQTEVFQKLFTQTLMESLTVTPKQLAKNGEMDSFYQHMEAQMDSFEKLISSTLSGSDSQQLSGQAHDMKSNIDFMKTMNEAFQYMQLPLKLQNQNAHGELYVYTKKEKLKQQRDQISLLLHLEMDHLGTVDIRLEKDKNNIRAAFQLDNEDALQLVSRNTHMLQDSLNEKGYTCQIQVRPLEQSETPVQDFLNTKITTAASREMKRFSFDIRA